MKIHRVSLVAAFAVLAGLAVAAAPPQGVEGRPLALVGGSLIDGSGVALVRNSVVLIREERIEGIGTVDSVTVPADYERISTEGMTVLPGMFDPHVHLVYNGHPDSGHWYEAYTDQFADLTIPAAAEQTLLAGVTSVRDLGAPAEDVLAVKRRIDSGELPGPTIYPAGPILRPGETQGRANMLSVSGVDDARNQTRRLLGDGVRIIKFHAFSGAQNMPLEVARAIVEEAHAQGMKVTTHGRTDEEIRVGLAADVDEFQHIGTGSPEYPPDIVRMIRERIRSGRELYWTPTVGMQLNIERATDLEFLDDPRNFVGMPPEVENDVRTALANTEPSNPPAADTAGILERKISQLRELGVILVAGTDMGTFGMPASQSLWRDLDVWVREFGLAPMTAIRWVTADAAEALGVASDYGTVAVGKYADVIAVRGNPLMHINVLRDPAIVIKHGRRYK